MIIFFNHNLWHLHFFHILAPLCVYITQSHSCYVKKYWEFSYTSDWQKERQETSEIPPPPPPPPSSFCVLPASSYKLLPHFQLSLLKKIFFWRLELLACHLYHHHVHHRLLLLDFHTTDFRKWLGFQNHQIFLQVLLALVYLQSC